MLQQSGSVVKHMPKQLCIILIKLLYCLGFISCTLYSLDFFFQSQTLVFRINTKSPYQLFSLTQLSFSLNKRVSEFTNVHMYLNKVNVCVLWMSVYCGTQTQALMIRIQSGKSLTL